MTLDHVYRSTPDIIEHIYSVETDLKGTALIEAIKEEIHVPHSSEYWLDRKTRRCSTEYFFVFTSDGGTYLDRVIFRRRG